MRLIDADALELGKFIEARTDWHIGWNEALEGAAFAAPTIDAVEVVHGWWDDSGRYQFPNGRKAIRCNICGCALSESEYSLFNWNYCPVCGAKMDGERKTE